ncbi:MAG: DUF4956 domain-containing protein [Bacteroidota bacterium]
MGVFEEYLNKLPQSVDLIDFLINLGIVSLLCLLLRMYYIRFGNAVANRVRFGNNFLPLGLTTVMVITIINFSPLLSLGLVGALSIVRYRAAIKDPEELTYLFLVIGIGLAAGANQPLVAIIGFVAILALLFVTKQLLGWGTQRRQENMYLNVSTDIDDLPKIVNEISRHLAFLELKRMDKTKSGLELAFVIKADSLDELSAVQKALESLSPATTFSMVDQPELVI